ncbi:hypothetical protein BDW22DRAFT_975669 [Trametopsis cervina]|nr:hypothetical protein BDW22DRAFT_975669 [Trametopsis cervina]
METRRCSNARLCVPGSSLCPGYNPLASAPLARPHAERAPCSPSAPPEENQHVRQNRECYAWVEVQRGSSASSTSISNAARVFCEYISCQFSTNLRPFHVPHGIFGGREMSHGYLAHLASTNDNPLKVHPFPNMTWTLSSYAYAQTHGVRYHPILAVLIVQIIYRTSAAVFPGGETLDLERYQARHGTVNSRTYAQRGSRSSS